MIQVYSPEHEAVFLFDLGHLSIGELAELGLFRGRKFVAHNAAFEHLMLRAHAHDISLFGSMQLAGLVLGCELGARSLDNVAEQILGDHKTYCIGGQIFGVMRVWPARTYEEKLGEPFAVSPEMSEITLRCGRAFGVDLFGLDIIVTAGNPMLST